MTRKYYTELGFYIARLFIFIEILPKLLYYFLTQTFNENNAEYFQAYRQISHMIITGKSVPKP